METQEQRKERISKDKAYMEQCFLEADNILAQALAPSERSSSHDEGYRAGYWMAKKIKPVRVRLHLTPMPMESSTAMTATPATLPIRL